MRHQITFGFSSLFPGEMVVDLFAGGGGASCGIESAVRRPVDVAINHDAAAIAMHLANHPKTKHYQENILEVSPREVCGSRPVGLLWASPDCTGHSRAKGGKPRSKGNRALANVVITWARDVRPRVIALENVEEWLDWGPLDEHDLPISERKGEDFRAWLAAIVDLGYRVEHRTIVAADHGAPTTRKRLFLVARCDGKPIVWPVATHGRGRRQPWRPASEIIDWTLPCPSIFLTKEQGRRVGVKRPLADATLRRIAAGLKRYVIDAPSPFIVPLTHAGDPGRVHGLDEPLRTVTAANRGELALVQPYIVNTAHGEANAKDGRPRWGRGHRGLDEPLATVCAGGGDFALCAPALVQTGYGEREGQAPRALDIGKPLGTVVSGQKHAVAAFMLKHYGGVVGHRMERTLGTVTCQDHHSLSLAWLEKLYGTGAGANVEDPLPTVTAAGQHLAAVHAFMVSYYGNGQPLDVGDPLDTVTTRDRFGLVWVAGTPYRIVNIGMRMLGPRELFDAQGFPRSYIIDPQFNGKPLTKTEQIDKCGNSVCPPVSEALVAANACERLAEAA